MKEKLLFKTLVGLMLMATINLPSFAKDDRNKNDCSIGVCHFELISNNSIDKFADILAALNKSADGDETVEVKSLSQCKDLSKKQFEHMFYDGQPAKGKEEIMNDPSMSITSSTLKYAVVNKDYIIREVRLSVTYNDGLIKKATPTKSTIFTMVQDKSSCELKQMIKGNPFAINK